MHVKIKVMAGASAGKEVPLRGPRFLVGRSTDCNLRVNSDAISRRHCRLKMDGSRVSIKDLGSRNGTYVNGNRIDGDHPLKSGDQLRIGPLELLLLIDETAEVKAKSKVAKSVAATDDMAGLVSEWLEEADDRVSNVAEAETQQLKSEDTDRVALGQTREMPAQRPAADATKEPAKSKKADDQKKSDAGMQQVPSRAAKDAPKDTHEAASQMLRKFFNRG